MRTISKMISKLKSIYFLSRVSLKILLSDTLTWNDKFSRIYHISINSFNGKNGYIYANDIFLNYLKIESMNSHNSKFWNKLKTRQDVNGMIIHYGDNS